MHWSPVMQGVPSPNGVDNRPTERNPVVNPPPDAPATWEPPQTTEPRAQATEPQARVPERPRPPEAPRKPLSAYLPAENVAGALSYLLGWISGAIFLLIDKRPFVRYHAAQSVVVFATLSVVLLVLGGFFLGAFVPEAHSVLFLLRRIVEIVWLVTAIVLMLKALMGERFRMPYAARFAERAAEPRT